MGTAIYALYDPNSELVKTFRNKKVATEAQYNSWGVCELRTFRFLTEKQVQRLPYATAVSIELTALSNELKGE
jgi:hypothetical protein